MSKDRRLWRTGAVVSMAGWFFSGVVLAQEGDDDFLLIIPALIAANKACSTSQLRLCDTQSECVGYGGNWYWDSCHPENKEAAVMGALAGSWVFFHSYQSGGNTYQAQYSYEFELVNSGSGGVTVTGVQDIPDGTTITALVEYYPAIDQIRVEVEPYGFEDSNGHSVDHLGNIWWFDATSASHFDSGSHHPWLFGGSGPGNPSWAVRQ